MICRPANIRMTDPAISRSARTRDDAGQGGVPQPAAGGHPLHAHQGQGFWTPIVIVTPWINKFYILDLNPKKSMIRYLVDQGFDVFITGWKNPGEDMRDVPSTITLTEAYSRSSTPPAARTGAATVRGGLLHRRYCAIDLHGLGDRHFKPEEMPVAHWTLFTTLVDFHKPGDIEVFVDEGSIPSSPRTWRARATWMAPRWRRPSACCVPTA